ncbi:hypothetical protein [Ruegeria aquimaris]|uniref:DUF948 domain-containing protein n=1 Tax=Ruegeria aquimaris TaxID=2984333 RepID=A0ABT3AFN0_9RHOB|nr:hypothetical protein [Ruegeria sp. XHP0148]MCV2887486.1 hypothetical protein [Ruegeria sp. XHP0148]
MELIADILLVAGALGAGLYCFVLARRLKKFNDLEKGVGGAVAVLSAQVDELNKTLTVARQTSDNSGTALKDLTTRAESVAQRLELMMASMHDLTPQAAPASPPQEMHEVVREEPKTPPAQQSRQSAPPPQGVMFMRHERNPGGAGS